MKRNGNEDEQAIRRALRAERWSQARSLISTRLQTSPGEPWLLVNLAYTYQMEGRSREAKHLLAQAHRGAPRDPLVLWEYASLLANLGYHEQALRLLGRIPRLNINPSSWIDTGTGRRRVDGFINDCRFRAGICNFYLGRSKAAILYLERYIEGRDQGIPSLYSKKEARNKIETLRNLKAIRSTSSTRKTAARLQRTIQKELKKTPRDHWLLMRLSETYYVRHKYRQALQSADEALRVRPGDAWATWACARCLEELDQHEAAIRLYKGILHKGLDRAAADGGRRWARMLLNDCRCAIGMCYWLMLNNRPTIRWLKEHLKYRRRNDESVYPLQFIRNIVSELTACHPTTSRSSREHKKRAKKKTHPDE